MNPSQRSTPRQGEDGAPEETPSHSLEKYFPSFNSWIEEKQLSNAGTCPAAKVLLVHLVEVLITAGGWSTKTADIFKSLSSSNHTAAFLQNKHNKNPVNSAVHFFIWLSILGQPHGGFFVHKEKKAAMMLLS